VEQSHAAGINVVVWTVDDVPTMESVNDVGVDGIISDDPDRLRSVMADHLLKLLRAYRHLAAKSPSVWPRCTRAGQLGLL